MSQLRQSKDVVVLEVGRQSQNNRICEVNGLEAIGARIALGATQCPQLALQLRSEGRLRNTVLCIQETLVPKGLTRGSCGCVCVARTMYCAAVATGGTECDFCMLTKPQALAL